MPDKLDSFGRGGDCARKFRPADWARNRGHEAIAQQLDAALRRMRPLHLKLPTPPFAKFPGRASDVFVGKIISFDVEKGFGFIKVDFDHDECSQAENVFLHISVLRPSRYGTRDFPQPNQRVAFKASKKARGYQATSVACGEDGGQLRLPLNLEEAKEAWRDSWRYRDDDY